MILYKAHINGERIQSCKEHSINTANLARENAKRVGLVNTAYLCGILHDVGKYTEEFNNYIEAAARGEDVVKGSVIHTFAGVKMVLQNYHSIFKKNSFPNSFIRNLTSELIAIAIGSHHGQFDMFDPEGKSGLKHRIKKQPDYDEKAAEHFYLDCMPQFELNKVFDRANAEIEKIYYKIYELVNTTVEELKEEEILFYLGVLERFLLSALIDADRRDTAEFMSNGSIGRRSIQDDEVNTIWKDAYCQLIQKLNTFSNETKIQGVRRELSDLCEKFADNPCGIYRLNFPTGAGKTLSSLRYALAHAKKFKKTRIIFAIPLLSILDQNACIIREAIGNDDAILEHHSNVVCDSNTGDINDRRELLIENWDVPIIITTLVQLLNTMFDGKTSSIRRFCSLANSVIVIDEVQSVPTKMLSLFNLTVNFLSKLCNTTFLLCSATQPLFELNRHKLMLAQEKEFQISNMEKYKEVFKRTDVQYIGELNADEIIDKAEEYFHKYKSVLVICNTKSEAYELFSKAKRITENVMHLSTSMCMAHRKAVIKEMKKNLEEKERVICISTQLIEAGVDVSFGAVIRLAAGIDNVTQAAGRANRNGEMNTSSPVGVVYLKGEDISRLKEIKMSQDVTGELIAEYKKNPAVFQNDLVSDQSVAYYYKSLFRKINRIKHYTDYCVNGYNLIDLLSCNNKFTPEEKESITMRQAFATAGKNFEVFDDTQKTVIVPYGKGAEIINDILTDRFSKDLIWARDILKSAKDYSVNLFNDQFKKLSECGAIYSNKDKTIFILMPNFYDEHLGIIREEGDIKKWNTLIL